ncbi:MAG TPA: ribonuclease E inhibitor RraB [Flavobacteriaceae bacterium]|nr:ribonuclease E inhibitor RraB [Flavobacteriaceae bacterium]
MDGINRIFKSLEIQGINTQQTFLYGYFFNGKSKSTLEALTEELKKQGYFAVEMRNENDFWVLHLEKTEQHTRESLFALKQNFSKLARTFGVDYDGFDVGNSNPATALISNADFISYMHTHQNEELYQLGIQLYELQIYDKAGLVFEECLNKNIKPDIVSFKLGNMLSWQGDVENGLHYLEQAVRINPSYLNAWFNLGAICYDNSLYEASIEYYQQADKIAPNDEDIIYGIAASQYAAEQYEKSLENCRRILAINEKHENAKYLLKLLKD